MSSDSTTSAAAAKRLMKELKTYTAEVDSGLYKGKFSLSPYYDADGNLNIFRWTGIFYGPTGTPYEGGIFTMDITVPTDYPFKPPHVVFCTPIYHPNFKGSSICVDFLKPATGAWVPSFSLTKIMLAICSLLNDANPDDPLDGAAAAQYVNNREAFDAHAREINRGAR
jgi:ubiquitin-protein ligase